MPEDLHTLKFYTSDGTEISGRLLSRQTPGDFPGAQGTLAYLISGHPASATVRINSYEKIEPMTVPIDLRVGIGGGGRLLAADAGKPVEAVQPVPAAATLAPPTEKPAEARLELLSLHASKSLPAGVELRHPEMARPPSPASLTFEIVCPNESIVLLGDQPVQIRSFVDDLGTDLGTHYICNPHPQDLFPAQNNIGPDLHHAFFEMILDRDPKPASTQLTLKGELRLRVGTDEHTIEEKAFAPQVGNAIVAGPVTLTVATISGSPSPVVTFTAEGPFEQIRRLEFINSDGDLVPYRIQNDMTLPDRGRQITYVFLAAFDSGTVRATYFKSTRTLTVPVELTAAIGL